MQELRKEIMDLQTRLFRTNGGNFGQQVHCNKADYVKHFVRYQLLQASVRFEILEDVGLSFPKEVD